MSIAKTASRTSWGAIFLLLLLGVTSNGCSVMMAAHAPPRRDLSVLTPGVSRSRVIAEIGAPLESTQTPYGVNDVHAFKQGYSLPARVTRAAGHATADFLTFGLWEIAGTPIETSFQGEDVRVELSYDGSNQLRRIEYYAGAHLANGAPAMANWTRPDSTQQTAVVGDPNWPPQPPGMQTSPIEMTTHTDQGEPATR